MAKKRISISDEAFAEIRNIYETRGGQLNQQEILTKLFNKLSTQRWVDTFSNNPTLEKRINAYIEASNMYGDTDEINSLGLGHGEAFVDTNGEGVREKFIPETYSVWAQKTFEDQYYYTVKADQMARAMQGATQLGSFLSLVDKTMMDTRFLKGHDRIRHYLKSYLTVVEIEEVAGEDFSITAAKKITETLIRLTLPNTTNEKTKVNLYTPDEIQLTLNVPFANQLSGEQAKIYNASSIGNLNKILNESVIMDLTEPIGDGAVADDDIVAVVDTPGSLYFGRMYGPARDFQHFASDKYTNFYLHETYSAAAVNFHAGIIFKKKTAAARTTKPTVSVG